jgi:PAS domain S-box-containing protein
MADRPCLVVTDGNDGGTTSRLQIYNRGLPAGDMARFSGPIRVLHVDDEPEFADLTARFLEREDDRLDVTTVASVEAGLDRLADGSFDCVVSDYDMPGRNGLAFLEAVREDHGEIPFILFTGKGSESVASEAISRGVTDYLQKGTSTDQYTILANRIGNAVDQSRAEAVAERTEQRLAELAANSNDVLWAFTADWGELLFVNEAYERVWGQPTEALETEPEAFLDAIHPADRDPTRAAMERLSGGEPVDIEIRVDPGSDYNQRVWVQGTPITDDDGRVVRVAGFARDVTERRRHEQALEELHAVAADLPGCESPEAVCRRIVTAAESILEFDHCVANLVADDTLVPVTTSGELPAADVGPLSVDEGVVGRVYRSGESSRIDDLRTHPDADPPPGYRSALTVSLGDHGVFQATARTTGAFDESDRELAELLTAHATAVLDQLAHSRELERYETILEALGDPVYTVDEEGHYTFVNESYSALTGYDREEIVGEHVSFLLDEASVERATDCVRTLLSDDESRCQQTYDIIVETATGERVPCEDNLALLPLEDGAYRGVAGVVRDISDRVARERELEQYETMANAAGDMVYRLDTDGRFEFVNDTAERLTGYPRDRLEGSHVGLLMDEADVETGRELVRGLVAADGATSDAFTWTLHTADGESVPCQSHITPLYDGEEWVGTVGVVRDITARHERERRLERQNEQLEEFARVVSHDLRSPLNVAQGRLQLARSEHDIEDLAEVAEALERMDELVDDLLTLAREGKTVTEPEAVDLGSTVRDCWRHVETGNATLAVETTATVRADRSRLTELLENLVRNSVEHGSATVPDGADAVANGGGGVTVTVGALDDGDGFYVADDGPGIPVEEREQVFEAGYSTQEEGSGFGLNIVARIAEAHGWSVSVVDAAGGGSRFEFTGVEFAAD